MSKTAVLVALSVSTFGLFGLVEAGHDTIGVSCTDFTGNAHVDIPILAAFGTLGRFNPPCVVVDSGATITWENDDPVSLHDPRSSANSCFQSDPTPDGTPTQPDDMGFGETWSITVEYDALQNLDVTEQGGPKVDCDGALDAQRSDEAHGVVRYHCAIHTAMVGWIVVHAP